MGTLKQLMRWLLLLAMSPVIIAMLLAYAIYGALLLVSLWIWSSPVGTRVLFVYSSSPLWQIYIEQHILPKLPPRSVVLNWSERRHWRRWSLAVLAFHFFGGRYAFNPLAVVVRPFRWGKTFRFWSAFRDFKHGNRNSLEAAEAEFFAYLQRT